MLSFHSPSVGSFKPCPFCGRLAELVSFKTADGKTAVAMACNNGCGATGPFGYSGDGEPSVEYAERAWNERSAAADFQARVAQWMTACFSDEIASSLTERNHRFFEEAAELIQANGCTREEAHRLVDYVFGRPAGEPHQEVGGVLVCLAALCTAAKLDMDKAGEDELARVWTKIETIRAKHAAKPKFSPLPGSVDG